jgi:hypothetical protein
MGVDARKEEKEKHGNSQHKNWHIVANSKWRIDEMNGPKL